MKSNNQHCKEIQIFSNNYKKFLLEYEFASVWDLENYNLIFSISWDLKYIAYNLI